jgi:hypothetical protein
VIDEGGFAYGDPRAHAVAELKCAFADFSRNGRWGTCASCPQDGYGRKLPELCEFTEQPDHQFDIDGLAKRFKDEVASFETRGLGTEWEQDYGFSQKDTP